MIKKAIQKTQQPLILILSIFGTVIGLSLLLIVTQLYMDMQHVQQSGNGGIGAHYLVIKKQISLKNTIGGAATTEFTDDELADLVSQPFVKEWAPFTTGQNFQVFAVISMESSNNEMSTLGFIESIPDKFIDVATQKWSWNINDTYVPIILPTTFLDAYNFGIAGTLGAPVISKNMIGGLGIELFLTGNGKQQKYTAHVVDFSDRINSTLVPESFLKYANNTYGNFSKSRPNKIIIATENVKDPAIQKYLENNNLETNKEQLRGSFVEKLIHPILGFAGSLCLIIITMTILIFLLYAEILIIKSTYEIKLLSLLGYAQKSIAKVFILFFIKVYSIIVLLSVTIYIIAKTYTNSIIEKNLMITDLPKIAPATICIGMLFLALFLTLNIVSIKKQLTKLNNP